MLCESVAKGIITFKTHLSVSHPNFLAGRDCISQACLLVYIICLVVNFMEYLRTHSVNEDFHSCVNKKNLKEKVSKINQKTLGLIDCLWQKIVPGHRKHLVISRENPESSHFKSLKNSVKRVGN